jgi:hypothetical protein
MRGQVRGGVDAKLMQKSMQIDAKLMQNQCGINAKSM